MNDAELEKSLFEQVEQLPRQIKPSRDLWAGIDHAIEQQQNPQKFGYQKLTAVAAGLAIFALTAWMTLNTGIEGVPSVEGYQLQYVQDMSNEFEQQKQTLLVKYQGQQATADNWHNELKILDEAAIAIKKALAQEPANAQLIKMLQQTYQQQLDLINAVNKSPWQTI